MALWAVGDLQGCAEAFDRLLADIGFSPRHDQLLLVGDLVNRGPDSVGVMERVLGLGDAVHCVLGNHDLNTLAVAEGVRPIKPRDTLDELLAAPAAGQWLDYLRRQPLLIRRPGYLVSHAGIYPRWDAATAAALAGEVEQALAGKHPGRFLAGMYGNEPARWRNDLRGIDRLRFVTNAFTRMRYVDFDGGLDLVDTNPPGSQRNGLVPWFQAPGRVATDVVVFGHWSSLGYYIRDGVLSLDTGCVWGRSLTAVRLDPSPLLSRSVRCPGLP